MLTIKLTADTGDGVDFNAEYAAFFEGFEPYAYPLFLPDDGTTTQVVHLETPETGRESAARAVLVEGEEFDYTFSNHAFSGTIETVRLVRLGDAYDATADDLLLDDNGRVATASPIITITGLTITNAAGVKGDVHEIIAGFMGGGPEGTRIDPDPFSDHLWAQGHRLVGSVGGDSFRGTKFSDVIRGGKGADVLAGARGNDLIAGGAGRDDLHGNAGKDTLSGGRGKDTVNGGAGSDWLTGGQGADRFDFNTVAEANRDTITDFSGNDRIDLRDIDAVFGRKGNQAFDFIGSSDFSGTAGEVRVTTRGEGVVLRGDLDGDGRGDFRLFLPGVTELETGDVLL